MRTDIFRTLRLIYPQLVPMIQKILFLEDDLLLGTLISKGLRQAGFEVRLISRLEELYTATETFRPDLTVVDLEIGGLNSLKEMPSFRKRYPQMPIVFASSHTDGKEIIACWNLGYTDYVKKPYEVEELIYHIRKWLGTTTAASDMLTLGHYQLNLQTRDLIYQTQIQKRLNPKEFNLLRMLITRKEEVIDRSEFLKKVWNNQPAEESLNNYITYLRKHLNKDPRILIRTVKGKGYILTYREE